MIVAQPTMFHPCTRACGLCPRAHAGVEFAGELADFINHDLRNIDPDRARDMRITLVEANELLGSFDARLREYAARKLVRKAAALR